MRRELGLLKLRTLTRIFTDCSVPYNGLGSHQSSTYTLAAGYCVERGFDRELFNLKPGCLGKELRSNISSDPSVTLRSRRTRSNPGEISSSDKGSNTRKSRAFFPVSSRMMLSSDGNKIYEPAHSSFVSADWLDGVRLRLRALRLSADGVPIHRRSARKSRRSERVRCASHRGISTK